MLPRLRKDALQLTVIRDIYNDSQLQLKKVAHSVCIMKVNGSSISISRDSLAFETDSTCKFAYHRH